MKVFIVLRGPDMNYYGTAEIHGVYATREEAEGTAKRLDPHWSGASWDALEVQEWQIGETGIDVPDMTT
jgi:hypothetical protein